MLLKKRKGCHACPIMCKRVIALEDPVYGVDSRYGGPEYETIASSGQQPEHHRFEGKCQGNEICNRYCMDTISAGMSIALLRVFEKGIITAGGHGRDGAAFRGSAADAEAARDDGPPRRSSASFWPRGSARLGGSLGVSGSAAVPCRQGQELALHDPRIKVGVGMSYALCTYGADHMNTPHDPSFVDSNSFAFKSVNAPWHPPGYAATTAFNDKVRRLRDP